MQIILLFLSILPVFVLGTYIYKNDFDKEPTKLILKLFIYGIGSAFVTLFISDFLYKIFPMFATNPMQLDPIKLIPYSFIGIALVEEFSKWIFVYFDTYNRSEFNHAYDAIVYAVFVALGFACVENILYVFTMYDIQTAIVRALLAVPGHACDGVLMGYFLALAKISDKNNNRSLVLKNKFLSILMPMLIHGLYDYFLFASPFVSTFSLVFFIFVYLIFKKAVSLVSQMKVVTVDLSSNAPFYPDNFAYAAPGFNIVSQNRQAIDYNVNSRLFTEPEEEKYIPQQYCVICGQKVYNNVCSKCGREQVVEEANTPKKRVAHKNSNANRTKDNLKKNRKCLTNV